MWWRKRHTPTDAAPQAPRPERLARVQTLAEQALALPSGGMRRWNTLAPLGEADLDDVAAVASAFLTGDDPPRAVLAGEMLDTAIARHGFRGSRPSADTTAALRLLLEPACHPDQPPDLIVAALSPLAMLEGTHPGLLQPLVSHPDPKVRAIALRLWANLLTDDDDAPPEPVLNATLDLLTDALHHDPAPQVRAEAAGALDMLHLGQPSGRIIAARAGSTYGSPASATTRSPKSAPKSCPPPSANTSPALSTNSSPNWPTRTPTGNSSTASSPVCPTRPTSVRH